MYKNDLFFICVQFLQNFNIYKHLCVEVYGSQLEGVSGYTTYATLRNILLNLVYCSIIIGFLVHGDVMMMQSFAG